MKCTWPWPAMIQNGSKELNARLRHQVLSPCLVLGFSHNPGVRASAHDASARENGGRASLADFGYVSRHTKSGIKRKQRLLDDFAGDARQPSHSSRQRLWHAAGQGSLSRRQQGSTPGRTAEGSFPSSDECPGHYNRPSWCGLCAHTPVQKKA